MLSPSSAKAVISCLVEWLVVSSDANILIYSLIECDYSPLIHKLLQKDSDWRTTALYLHETLNVLATYQWREVLTLAQCRKLLDHADHFIKIAQCEVEMDAALATAAEYAIAQYVTKSCPGIIRSAGADTLL